ncbi:TetR/AcrR family transcriptional regulator [Actinokineospora xionganensis]|uniref:TetR/AcrR family transcriptional regulator n=1 Tax=Actinokineospora xionganensis TaxID=2684470 RepID=A0ABR7L8A2_9PSEU|nr:TetR/AcrR family transcriptional regulator [Actinokineospora xionganensis]MBC6448733.1 TetR/AcrR family transcriptional regulator [Actinokineospora xionganensis]
MAYRKTEAVLKKQAMTRERIVRAATELVVDEGYAGCSMAGVARRAEVATGSIYQFFPSKGELFAEVFRTAVSREVVAASQAGAEKLTSSARASILAAVETFCTRAMRSPKMAYALIAEPVDPLVEAERLVFHQSFSDILASAIVAAIAAGEIPDQDAGITAAGIVGAISDVLVLPLSRGDTGEKVLPALLAFVGRALGRPD